MFMVIEALDVVGDRRRCRPVGRVRQRPELSLERAKEALDGRIVVTVTRPAHAAAEAIGAQQRLVPIAGVLRPAIRMMEHRATARAAGHRNVQRGADQVGLKGRAERPADHASRPQVKHHGEIEPAVVRRHAGDVGRPDPIGRGDGESTPQVIGRGLRVWIDHGRGPKPPSHPASQAVEVHQPNHAFTADTMAGLAQHLMQPRTAIHTATRSVRHP